MFFVFLHFLQLIKHFFGDIITAQPGEALVVHFFLGVTEDDTDDNASLRFSTIALRVNITVWLI